MASGRKKIEVDFATKKRSLLHTYDNFLVAQTRLFTLANYLYTNLGGEIEDKQEDLFFDDFLSFGIASRRLIELTGLKTFANHVQIQEQVFDPNQSRFELSPSGKEIGFLTLANSIIHAKYVQLFRSRFDFWPYVRQSNPEKDVAAQYYLFEKVSRENRWSEYAIEVTVIVVSDTERFTMVKLRDVLNASSTVVERAVEKCGDFGIHLEMEFRRLD